MNKNHLNHVAIILDGNGRWAKEKNKPRSYGHKRGFEKLEELFCWAIDAKINYLTLYCFSTENWKRPKEEIDFLFKNFSILFNGIKEKILNKKIKISWLGRKNTVDSKIRNDLCLLEKDTDIKNFSLCVNLCIDYGSLEELKNAINEIIVQYSKDNFFKNFNENDIYNFLYTKNLPPLDLLIRPGKEKRLSNFLLLQSAYTELYFCDVYWPEFSESDFIKAINEYYNRKRRYGDV